MRLKRIGKMLLFPPIAVVAVLTPVAAAGLIYAMLCLDEADPIRVCSYALAFYALTVLCVRIPELADRLRNFCHENRFVQAWTGDVQLRTNITLAGSSLWNGAYGALQLGLGICHRSAWFYALAAYYATLACMRFSLVRHTLRHRPGEQMRQELVRYRACGWVFLLTNLALSAMMFYMISQNRAVRHNEITTIAMAAYTFITLTMAIVNVIRVRPVSARSLG